MENLINNNVMIDRRTWFRGRGVVPSFLMRRDGKKCILGFLALASGFKEFQLDGKADILELKWTNLIKSAGYTNLSDLMCVNDDKEISDIQRERGIIDLGKLINVNFKFIN